MDNAAAVLDEIITTRRSIRIFDDTPVPESVIQHCFDLAMKAPNSSNMQPWEFYWIQTPALKSEIAKACLSQPAATTAKELIACVARTNTWERSRLDMLRQMEAHEKSGTRIPPAAFHYYRKVVPFMYRQGPLGAMGLLKRLYFFFLGLKEPTMREPSSQRDMKLWAVKSTALACENFMLGMRAHGFDTCPMEGFDSRRVEKLLDLPGDASVAMILGVGKRSAKGVTLPPIRADRALFIKVL